MSGDNDIREQKRMGTTMQALAWVVLIALGVLFFSDLLDKQYNPNQSLQTGYVEGGGREVVLQRNKFGHYVTSGMINGKSVTFILDTGATGVAIPDALASYLGLQRGAAFPTQTSNETSMRYAARRETVSIGPMELS